MLKRPDWASGGRQAAGYFRPNRQPDGRRSPNLDPTAWVGLAYLVYYPFARETPNFRRIPAAFHSARLVREVFGPTRGSSRPFPWAWKTSLVTDLARGMYEFQDFCLMPQLGDRLMDAGCADADAIEHCHHGQRHVRGCWVLDGILQR